MKAPSRIVFLPVDGARGASTRYRVLAHLPALAAAGYRTSVRFPWTAGRRGAIRPFLRVADLLRDRFLAPEADLLFVHRKTFPPRFARGLCRTGRPLVFDMDDTLDLAPPGRTLSEGAARRYRENFEATVRAATLVLCGNAELASRLPHDRHALLPTPIDTERFRPDAAGPRPAKVLGWVGHGDNLPYLEGLAEALRELARRHADLRLVVVADRPPRIEGVPVEFRRWSLDSEVSCFDGIGVGLMPLDDSPWARGKCAFKAIQYMALGIPTVASPVGMNRDVIRDGETGFLPADPRNWVAALDALLSDASLAREIGAAGRRRVETTYSLRIVSRTLVGILESLRC